jgi:hypothetical protein
MATATFIFWLAENIGEYMTSGNLDEADVPMVSNLEVSNTMLMLYKPHVMYYLDQYLEYHKDNQQVIQILINLRDTIDAVTDVETLDHQEMDHLQYKSTLSA